MIAKFREVDSAIAYLCDGLGQSSRDAYAHVAFYPHGTSLRRTIVVEMPRLGQTLNQLCGRYLEARVILGLGSKAAPVAGIQCRCHSPSQATCRCQCHHDYDRPIVSIMVRKDADPPSDEDRYAALDSIYEMIQNDEHDGGKKRRRRRRSIAQRSPI